MFQDPNSIDLALTFSRESEVYTLASSLLKAVKDKLVFSKIMSNKYKHATKKLHIHLKDILAMDKKLNIDSLKVCKVLGVNIQQLFGFYINLIHYEVYEGITASYVTINLNNKNYEL